MRFLSIRHRCALRSLPQYTETGTETCFMLLQPTCMLQNIYCLIGFQITSLTIVYSTVYSDADQRNHQSSASLAFVRGIHREPMNSPHKWPVTRKMFPFDHGHHDNKTNIWWIPSLVQLNIEWNNPATYIVTGTLKSMRLYHKVIY